MNDYNAIMEDNKDLVASVVKYICDIKKINSNSILKAPRDTIRQIINHFQKIERDLGEMKKDRDSFNENLKIMEANAGVSARSYDGIGGGHDNGQKNNPVYTRLLAVEEMREKVYQKTVDIVAFEETYKDKKQMIIDFIYLLPNITPSRSIELHYFDKKNDEEIASIVGITFDYARQSRAVGIEKLAIILKAYIRAYN